jgi:hypothetical protein
MKLTDITPSSLRCGDDGCSCGCPAIFSTDEGGYVLIGSLMDAQKLGIAKRVGKGEVAIRVPAALLKK